MEKKRWTKPLPSITQDEKPFWEGLKRHDLLLFRCKKCGAWYWPVAFCRFHDNEPFYGNMEWTKASGKGKVFNFYIPYREKGEHGSITREAAFVWAFIETDEGPLLPTSIIGCDPKDVRIGMPAEIVFYDVTKAEYENIKEDLTLPYFQLVK